MSIQKIVLLAIVLTGLFAMSPIGAQAQSNDFELIDSSAYIDVNGWYHIVGEIENVSNDTFRFVEIDATLRDSSGVVVGTAPGYTFLEYMNPGDKSGFHLLFPYADQVPSISTYSLAISADSVQEGLPKQLEVIPGNSFVDINGWYHVVGEVRNNGPQTATFVEVFAVLYDGSEVVDATTGYTNPEDIPSGGSASFEFLSLAPGVDGVNSISFSAESDQYASMTDGAPSPEPEQEPAPSPAITVSLNKSEYRSGETIIVSGTVSNKGTNNLVLVRILLPNHSPFMASSTQLNSDGTFEESFTFYGRQGTEDELYIVEAIYGDVTAQQTFVFSRDSTETTDSPNIQDNDSLFENDIQGSYTDSTVGLSIDFPEGWTGISLLDTLAMVAPGGVDLTTDQPVNIVILSLPRSSVEDLWSDSDGLDDVVAGTEADTDTQTCSKVSTSFTHVSGMSAMQSTQECNDEGYSKSKTVGFMTSEHFVVISYSAASSEAYDEYLDDFDDSLQTLQILGVLDFESALAEMLNLQAESYTVVALDYPVDVSIQSNSQVSDFELDEEEKRLSFRVEGEDGTRGTTIIAVASVLEPPYTVMVDGEVWTDVSEITNDGTGEVLLRISYDHSVHDVAITGTNVVPEFGVIAALVLAVSLVAFIGTARFKGFIGFPKY